MPSQTRETVLPNPDQAFTNVFERLKVFVSSGRGTVFGREEYFKEQLGRYRKLEIELANPGLKAKLDAFALAPAALAPDASNGAKLKFVIALRAATEADKGSRDGHLNKLHALFVEQRGDWFVEAYTKGQLEAVPAK